MIFIVPFFSYLLTWQDMQQHARRTGVVGLTRVVPGVSVADVGQLQLALAAHYADGDLFKHFFK